MPKQNRTFVGTALVKMLTSGAVLLLASSWSWAQESDSRDSVASVGQTFSAFHQTLNATASQLLASAQHPPAVAHPSSDLPLTSGLSRPDEEEQVVRSIQLREAVERVQKLQPVFEPVLRQEGVPQQLAAVVLVESGGWSTALSAKGARGLWQLMPDTARRYGLVVSTNRDERLNVDKSTRAAARYLRDLHEQFNDWSLVFAAYNAGEQTVQRAIDRSGTTDFSRLNRFLPAETRSYVPAVWASLARLGYKGTVGHLPPASHLDLVVRRIYGRSPSYETQ